MQNDAEQGYITGLKEYHKRLAVFVAEKYKIDITYLEVLSWGYHTTALYLKSSNGKEFLLKLADWSKEKEAGILKDISMSDKYRAIIPTPIYLKTITGDNVCRFEDKILRVSDYISGLAPLEMTYDILGQMVDVLKKMHALQAPSELGWAIGTHPTRAVPKGCVVLHGDLTPHNVLVAYGQLVAVIDFELSFMGPKEYDLARTAVFSWNYFGNEPFEQVAQFTLRKYTAKDVNADLFYKFALENAQKHLAAVAKHKNNYDRKEDWDRDHDFALRQLKRLVLLKD